MSEQFSDNKCIYSSIGLKKKQFSFPLNKPLLLYIRKINIVGQCYPNFCSLGVAVSAFFIFNPSIIRKTINPLQCKKLLSMSEYEKKNTIKERTLKDQ